MGEVPLVYRYGRHLAVGAETTALLWTGDGTVRVAGIGGEPWTVGAHAGAILSACRHPDGASIVTGGDDGAVRRVRPGGEVEELDRFRGRWVGQLAASAVSGLVVAGIGREAVVWTTGGTAPHRFTLPSTVGGLALDGKGKRLAVAHYHGATLLYGGNPRSGRVELTRGGSHLACTLRADGAYLVTALQETGLHGWKLGSDARDMQMSGYRAKTRSFAWSRRGRWLATGGDRSAILWPFDGKNGPMGRRPLLRGGREGALVTAVAFHPQNDLLAVGYSDGAVELARLDDEATLPVDEPAAAITALAWNDAGSRLGWGDEDGRLGLLDMTARA